MAKTAYLAGPDVFKHDRSEIFKGYRQICKQLNLVPLTPYDLKLDDPQQIYFNNLDLIDQADVVIANISPFRGQHCDVGTAFEIGYATGRGVPVVAFSDDGRDLIERIEPKAGSEPPVDNEGLLIEDHGLPENLMVAEALADGPYTDFGGAADAATTTAARLNDDSLAGKDWAECRTTIGRFDGILVDLRKFGFSIITGLLTVMFGYFGLADKATSQVNANGAGALFIAIMVLIAALYGVDANYQVLLRGAVRRAREIEKRSGYLLKITERISLNAMGSRVNYVTLYVYLTLLLTAEAFGLFAAGALNTIQPVVRADFLAIALVVVAGIVAFISWRSKRWATDSFAFEFLGLGAIVSVAIFLGESIKPDAPAVTLWIVAIGAFFALFIQGYWIFLDTTLGLTYDKRAISS